MTKKAMVLVLGLLAVPAMASATTAWTRSHVKLRAGPDVDYPHIVTLPRGDRVEVYGCVNDWSWCDVASNGYRGWISASYLDYEYEGRRVLIREGGSRLGLQILSFSLGGYWDEHYRGKSWYAQRSRMEKRHPPHAAAAPNNRPPNPGRLDNDRPNDRPNNDRPNNDRPHDRPQPGGKPNSKEPEPKKPHNKDKPDRDDDRDRNDDRDRDDDRRDEEQRPPR